MKSKNKKTSKYAQQFYAKKKKQKQSLVALEQHEPMCSQTKVSFSRISFFKRVFSKVKFPRLQLPKLTLFKSALTKITIPKIAMSKFTIPKFTLPKITIPKPTLSKLTLPKFATPGYLVPKFSLSQLNMRTGLLAVTVIAVIALAGGLAYANAEKKAYAVLVNGQQVALAENRQETERALAGIKAEKAKIWSRSVETKDTVSFRETTARRYKINRITEVTQILDNKIHFMAAAAALKIDGQVSIIVKDVATAETILKKLKDAFVRSEIKTGSVKFAEQVEIVQVPADLKEIVEPDQALEAIKNGRQKKVTHVVTEGDSLWMIARKNDMRVAELKAANPALKGEKLSLGQELNLVKLEPMINVLAEGQVTLNETLPYDVVVEKDSGMWRGRQKIKQKGENGARQVTYKVVLKNGSEVSKSVLTEKVLKQAKDQVVVKGARMVVASRRGSGAVGWPLGGGVTSGYGKRWGRMHTGIDIDGHTGQPVGAAAEGRITFTGWDGAYGKTVVVSHGNGLTTKYAHLSKIEVSEGQQVSRGDLIGLVGSTGRSTGSHLHFEVISNGSFQNPKRFLR